MKKDEAPKPPLAGVIYGEIAYWLLLAGMLVAVCGSAIYIHSGGIINATCLLDHLWQGADINTIWAECAGVTEVPHGHWYFGALHQADAVAMLGIAIGSTAAVVGMWGALIGLIRSREKFYFVFAIIIAIILTLSALGIITIAH